MLNVAGGYFRGSGDALAAAAEGAEAWAAVAVLEPAFEGAVAVPQAGDAKADASLVGDLGEAGAVAAFVLLQPGGQVVGVADVVAARVPPGGDMLLEVEQVDVTRFLTYNIHTIVFP